MVNLVALEHRLSRVIHWLRDDGEYTMRNLQNRVGKFARQYCRKLRIKLLNRRRWQCASDTGARSNSTAPGFRCIRNFQIIRECLYTLVIGLAQIPQPRRINPQTPAHVPIGIMLFNEFLSDTHQVARQWNPVEVSDQQVAAWAKEASRLDRGLGSIEPMPALPCRHYVKCLAGQSSIFGATHTISGVNPFSRVKFLGLRQHRLGGVESDNMATASGESSPEAAGTEIEHILPGLSQPQLRETVKQRIRKTRAMLGIVFCGSPKVRFHNVVDCPANGKKLSHTGMDVNRAGENSCHQPGLGQRWPS